VQIVQRESPLALYKGLGAVTTGIIPKMAIRFTSYEYYKSIIPSIFLAGLAAGVTEAVAVVTPMEVVKIRLQAQYHSMSDPLDVPKYRNAAHCAMLVVREEGLSTLWRGVTLTALRQGSNQAVNFTVYNYLKEKLQAMQSGTLGAEGAGSNLPGYQTAGIGLISGACGPLSNAPIDTIKTRLQRMPAEHGETALTRIKKIAAEMFKQEGPKAFYKVCLVIDLCIEPLGYHLC